MIINSGCKYTTADDQEVDYSVDIKWSDRHWGKYSDGMANYLDRIGEGDEWTGDVEWCEYVQRFGKRLLFSDDRGFVTCEKYPTESEAKARFDEIDSAYCVWSEENEEY